MQKTFRPVMPKTLPKIKRFYEKLPITKRELIGDSEYWFATVYVKTILPFFEVVKIEKLDRTFGKITEEIINDEK